MTTPAFITLVMEHTMEVENATDAENTKLRERILARTQEVLEVIWEAGDWEWKQRRASLSLPASASGVVDVPSDFGAIGDHGGLYIQNPISKLKYLYPTEFFLQKELNPTSTGTSRFYTISGIETTTDYLPQLYVYPVNTTDLTLTIIYDIVAPTLVDTTTDVGFLEYFPSNYHRSILLPGVRLLVAIDQGDGRTAEFDAWFERAKSELHSNEVKGRDQLQRLGQYGGVHNHRSW